MAFIIRFTHCRERPSRTMRSRMALNALGPNSATLAVAWVASHPAVTSVLVGGRDVAQLTETLAASTLELDATTRARISALSPTPPPATDRNEETTAHNYGAR
jgi:aryl-alcohol dehydrogenase-like predicted oxidoreductase